MTDTPTLGSLFAGIGGIDLGFERAGFKTLWQVEKNAFCRQVLRRHFPDASRRVTDVRYAGARNLCRVDVIAGGFPCQDISIAGKGAGIDGKRSGLWRHMCRVIGELRPRYVVVENVAALLGRGISRVLGDLSEIGYDAEWQVISAADVGAPHLRERIWIIAYPDSDGCNPFNKGEGWRQREAFGAVVTPGQLWSDSFGRSIRDAGRTAGDGIAVRCGAQDVADSSSAGLSQRVVFSGVSGEAQWGDERQAFVLGGASVSHAAHDSEDSYGIRRSDTAGQWRIEPNVGRVAHGVPARVDRLRALGNAVVPQIPELIALRLKEVLAQHPSAC